MLNYLYAILEAEATIAVPGERLDPVLGLLHADREERASLACDLMEPIRPRVDAFALSVFRDHVFTTDDAFERYDGHCRLLPPLTRYLAATASLWRHEVAPVAGGLAQTLVTPWKKGRTIVPGIPMPRLGARRRPRGRTGVVRGFDDVPGTSWSDFEQPAHGWKGTKALRQVWGANRAWDRAHSAGDPVVYRAEIWPGLRDRPLRELVAATGMSTTTCSQIRQGRKVPHPRHWEALRTLAEGLRHA